MKEYAALKAARERAVMHTKETLARIRHAATAMKKKKVVRPRGLHVYKIEVDDDELSTLIDFHRHAAVDADDSCEYEEAEERRARAEYLRTLV